MVPLWTLVCEKCGQTLSHLETWEVDGEVTGHRCARADEGKA